MDATNETLLGISLDTMCSVTEVSRSTWQRRISKGEITRLADGPRGRKMLLWSEVEPHICIPMAPGDHRLVFQADAGDAEAQNDIGQLFLLAGKPRAALYWFQQAVQQDNADAMHWLGHCYISGSGVPQDHHVGLMWIAKAAAVGHVIAQGQMTWLIDQAVHK